MSDIKLTTADSSGFIPQFWANRALDVLRNQIVLAQFVTRDVNFGEVGWKGKSITVPYPGTFSAVAKVADTALTPQVPSNGASVTLTLSNHYAVPFLVEDFAAAQANQSLMDRYIQPAVIALAENLETQLINQYVNFTGTQVGTAGTDITSTVVRSARKVLNQAKAPMNDRLLLVSPKDEIALLGDSNLATFFAYSQPGTVKNGVIGKLFGLDVAMSQLAPSAYVVALGSPSAGNFTLTYNGQTTGTIAYNATAATVQAAIIALSSVGTGNCVVTGSAGGPYTVNFTGTLAGTTLALTGSGAGLTGGTFAITTETVNLAMHKEAIMLACRPFAPIPDSAGVLSSQAMDPESGLSIRISAQYDINNVGMRVNLDILYGMVALRPTLGSVVAA